MYGKLSIMAVKKATQTDLFAMVRPPEIKKEVSKPKKKTVSSKVRNPVQVPETVVDDSRVLSLIKSQAGKSQGYSFEDYLIVCDYYARHPETIPPYRGESIGSGYFPMQEIVAFSNRKLN